VDAKGYRREKLNVQRSSMIAHEWQFRSPFWVNPAAKAWDGSLRAVQSDSALHGDAVRALRLDRWIQTIAVQLRFVWGPDNDTQPT